MIDIHCHILPGVDHDGPVCQLESLEMARLAVEDGIHTVVATPHLRDCGQSTAKIHEQVDMLNQSFRTEGIALNVLPGAEVRATLDMDVLSDYTLNDNGYVLLEFSRWMTVQGMAETVYDCCRAGLRPIIAHAERLPDIQRSPNMVAELNQSGALLQITAESLTGQLGIEARICARYLLRRGFVHFLATDAHSKKRRCPVLSEGVKVATDIIGETAAWRLVMQNPAAVIQGRTLNA